MGTTPPNPINAGDTAWVLASSALVLLMTAPGLAVVYGYSLAFGKGNPFFGGLDWFMLKGVGADANADYAATIPHMAFMIFQCMFAVITPALIIGSYAERMKFSAFLVFTTLWLTF